MLLVEPALPLESMQEVVDLVLLARQHVAVVQLASGVLMPPEAVLPKRGRRDAHRTGVAAA